MDSIDKLKEMIKSFPSSFGLVKEELLIQARKIELEFEEFQERSVTWSVLDFAGRAEEIRGEDWRDIYDENLFEDELVGMINEHDAALGITWDTIDVYLENCKK